MQIAKAVSNCFFVGFSVVLYKALKNINIMKYTIHAYSYLKSVSRYQCITLPFVCPYTQIANLGLI